MWFPDSVHERYRLEPVPIYHVPQALRTSGRAHQPIMGVLYFVGDLGVRTVFGPGSNDVQVSPQAAARPHHSASQDPQIDLSSRKILEWIIL
jgi:hypothetical protein